MQESTPEPAELVLQLLLTSTPDKRLTGAALSVLLRHKIPDFTPGKHGCRNLREYLKKNAPSVFEVGRRGADILYGLEPSEEPSPIREANILRPEFYRSNVWKTFVSPNRAYRLYVNSTTGDYRVTSMLHQLADPWIEIQSPPPERHLEIAELFASKIDDVAARSEIKQILGEPCWWQKIYEILERHNLVSSWTSFRKEQLTQDFRSGLQNTGLEPRAVEDAVSAAAKATMARLDNRGSIRRIAVSAVSRMTESELRALTLPLGHVLDALKKPN